MKIFRNLILSLILAICAHNSFSQARITIYYDSTWAINSREHASFYRSTFLDTNYFVMIGPVMDHYADGKVAMNGKYEAGRKLGEFSFYYPDGQLKVKGNFTNDNPVGTWEFFYEDGQPWQRINFIGKDMRVLSYYDRSGVHKVAQGNGRYEGLVYDFLRYDSLYVDGKVKGGFKEGMWVYFNDKGKKIYEEKYSRGNFRFRLNYNKDGILLSRSNEPLSYKMVLPFELLQTERFVYAPNIKQSDYPYFGFLPDEDTLYFDENWEKTDSLSASYYRPTNVNNTVNPSGHIRDYYMSGQLQMEGKFVRGSKTGYFRYFHENGELASEGSYRANKKTGAWRDFYPDGSEKQLIYYEDGHRYVEKYIKPDGKVAVVNGYGFYENELRERGNTFRQKGYFKDYQKHGKWTAYRKNGELYFEETYDQGKLIKGTSYDKQGNVYEYVQASLQAQPTGGMKKFYAFISNKLVYPIEARKLYVQGKVFTQLIIDIDGKLINTKTISSPHPLLAKEAEKVIRQFDDWQPGKLRGQLVKMKFILPITFNLTG